MKISIPNKILLLLLLYITNWTNIQGQTPEENDDFVIASLLITSVGELPHQITGHAALRLQCDSLGLDRVFTFDNNVGGDLKKFYLEGGRGKIFENTYQDYVGYIKDEGRELTAYNLNLTLDEKIRLWEVLDSIKFLPERPFDICDSHCFSVISSAIDEAIYPNRVNWDLAALTWKSYSDIAKTSGGKENQWNHLLIMLALGNRGDEAAEGNKYIYPVAFAKNSDNFFIINVDGSQRPLSDKHEILIKAAKEDAPNRPSPSTAGLIFLLIVLGLTILQYFSRIKSIGIGLDIFILVITITGGLLIILVTYLPNHYGGNWNWPLIVFNPLAIFPILIFKSKPQALRIIWAIYAVILIAFAIFIGLIAPSISMFWRWIALGIAIRCIWHIYKVRLF